MSLYVCVSWGCLRILTQQGKRRWTIAYIFCNLTSKLATAGCCYACCCCCCCFCSLCTYMYVNLYVFRSRLASHSSVLLVVFPQRVALCLIGCCRFLFVIFAHDSALSSSSRCSSLQLLPILLLARFQLCYCFRCCERERILLASIIILSFC